jgi:hypothetical protein
MIISKKKPKNNQKRLSIKGGLFTKSCPTFIFASRINYEYPWAAKAGFSNTFGTPDSQTNKG